jgi:hypothetical protein
MRINGHIKIAIDFRRDCVLLILVGILHPDISGAVAPNEDGF